MKILVTGANGFLAANIIEELNARGFCPRAMMRPNANTKSLQNLCYESFYGEITVAEDVNKAVKGMDVVIHAAASTSQSQSHYKELMQINYRGTRHVVDACMSQKAGRLIYVGTANAIGNGTKESPGTETTAVSPLFYRSFYARSKYKAQQLVLKSVKEHKLDAVIVNPAFMLGPRDSKPGSGQIILMYLGKKFAWVSRGGKSFIHVTDAAKAICNAIEFGKTGECYLLANQNLTYREFVSMLSSVEGAKRKIFTLPSVFMKLAGWAGDLLTLAGFEVRMNSVNAQILETGNYYSSARAVSQLGIQLTPVETAIKEAIQWFAEHGMLKNKTVKPQAKNLPIATGHKAILSKQPA